MKGDYIRREPRQRFAAVRMNLSVPPSNVEAIITKKDEYNKMFIIEGTVIPDQLKFCTGLLHLQGKSDGVRLWPPVYNLDVSNYFLTSKDTRYSSKYTNENKNGKVYEYFSSDRLSWFCTTPYHLLLNTVYGEPIVLHP